MFCSMQGSENREIFPHSYKKSQSLRHLYLTFSLDSTSDATHKPRHDISSDDTKHPVNAVRRKSQMQMEKFIRLICSVKSCVNNTNVCLCCYGVYIIYMILVLLSIELFKYIINCESNPILYEGRMLGFLFTSLVYHFETRYKMPQI